MSDDKSDSTLNFAANIVFGVNAYPYIDEIIYDHLNLFLKIKEYRHLCILVLDTVIFHVLNLILDPLQSASMVPQSVSHKLSYHSLNYRSLCEYQNSPHFISYYFKLYSTF